MGYMSEAAKVRELPNVMQYVVGRIADVGAGHDPITPNAIAFDGRPLDKVDVVRDGLKNLSWGDNTGFDTVFSSHFLEHVSDPAAHIAAWHLFMRHHGHLVLYLPQKGAYDSYQNEEHLFNWQYEDFLFFFKRCFCGEGKDFKGEHLPKMFDLVDHGLDIGEDRYSFFVVARKV